MPIADLPQLPEPLGVLLCESLGHFWPLFPSSHHQLREFYHPCPQLEQASHITFYGGSFDPLHLGHLTCIQLCPSRPLVVVPDHSPLKPWRKERNFWNLYQELKTKTQNQAGVYVYPGFCGHPKPNPTINWLRQLPGEKSLLLGDDCFANLAQWQDQQQLLGILRSIYVIPRTLSPPQFDAHAKALLTQHPQLNIERLPRHLHQELTSSKLR